jgi:hypothetical protein
MFIEHKKESSESGRRNITAAKPSSYLRTIQATLSFNCLLQLGVNKAAGNNI